MEDELEKPQENQNRFVKAISQLLTIITLSIIVTLFFGLLVLSFKFVEWCIHWRF